MKKRHFETPLEKRLQKGGYKGHRSKTPIGIQVLWSVWLKLHDLCVRVASRREGWQLAKET